MLENKNTVSEVRNAFYGLISRWPQPMKESVSLKTGQEKLTKLKCKARKERKREREKDFSMKDVGNGRNVYNPDGANCT